MFKPFLPLPTCVVLFFCIFVPPLYAGVVPAKSTDLTIKSLKSEDPELWEMLGLDALGDDKTVLHLADNPDQILQDALQEVISSLPREQISFGKIIDPLEQDSFAQTGTRPAAGIGRKLALGGLSQLLQDADNLLPQRTLRKTEAPAGEDQTAPPSATTLAGFQYYQEQARLMYIQLQQTVFWPLVYSYNQVIGYMRRVSGYCDQFFGQHCPSLFYNPMALVGRSPDIDPRTFPARWLQIREIRDHLRTYRIRLNSRHFISRMRRFDRLRLPAELHWRNVLVKGFSFQGTVIPRHSFSYCQLVDTDLQGTRFYRCSISCSEISDIQADSQTQFQTSTFQDCTNQATIRTLLAVADVDSTNDPSWQGLVHRMLNIYFISQLRQHVLLQRMVTAVTSSQVSEFLEHSQELVNLYPDVFSVALQVLYVVSLQNKNMAQYRPDIRLLMSHYAAEALQGITACNKADSNKYIGQSMGQVHWTDSPAVLLTADQQGYQNSLMDYMHRHGLQPVTTPKDDQCFYHVLAQHMAEINPDLTQKDKQKQAALLRQMIAGYLLIYLNHYYGQDELLPPFPVDEIMQTKMGFLDNVLVEGTVDINELLNTAVETANPSGWAGQTTGMLAGVFLGQPVFMVNDHGPNVHVSLMYPDGTSISDAEAETALADGEVQNVIPVVFDSVNHWFTMVGAMLQTWLVLQERATK